MARLRAHTRKGTQMADTNKDGDPLGVDNTDVFDVDSLDKPKGSKGRKAPEPLYRVYKDSRIPISKAVGTLWKKRFDAALTAYDLIYGAWNESFKYYNNNQTKQLMTTRGVFHRGDSTENIVYSNLNVMLPAVYSKDPDIAVNTTDEADEDFVSVMKTLLNALFKSRHLLRAKPKIKRAVGLALLTNFGVLKLDYVKKDDSRETAINQLKQLTDALVKCTDSGEADAIYGRIEALEGTMEVFKPSGPVLSNVLAHNLIIDPNAEDNDGNDAEWMIERIFFNTQALIAQYTEPPKGGDEKDQTRMLIYKPTHKAAFTTSEGKRDDGLGMVMQALSKPVVDFEDQERSQFRSMFYSECYLVWDKTTRRVMLFHRDDWTWPIWVWDDPLKLSRFFPYFIIAFGMSTGGTVSVGETSYYLDQQDEINDINRQVAKIRRTVFDFFFYNSDSVNKDEVEKFIDAIRGLGEPNAKHVVGVAAGEGKKVSDMIEAFIPPSLDKAMEVLFNKETLFNTINRISNTSDALRGTQFKTNTNEAAVQSYQDAARMAVGAKIDAVEDTISDMATALAELCVQFMDQAFVASLVGQKQAAKWQQMEVSTFNANYNLECVAGTTEKPNSIFKKKEAVQIAQAIGQFASAAPMTSMTLMLKVLEQAFTEVEIKPEDWDMLKQEAIANAQKGISTGGAAPGRGAAPGSSGPTKPGGAPGTGTQGSQPGQGTQPGSQGASQDIQSKLLNLPPQVKQKVVQMKQQGVPDDQIAQFLLSQVQAGTASNGQAGPPSTPQNGPGMKVSQVSSAQGVQ